jgi:hypothetical protein
MIAPDLVASTVRVFFAPVAPKVIKRKRDYAFGMYAIRIPKNENAEASPAAISTRARFGAHVLVFLAEVAIAALMFVIVALVGVLLYAVLLRFHVGSPSFAQFIRVGQYALVALSALLFVNTVIRAFVYLLRMAGYSEAKPTLNSGLTPRRS